MKRSRTKSVLLLLVVFALVQVACALSFSSSGTSSSSEHRSRSDFTDETEARIATLDVRPAMTSINLRMQVNLESGTLTRTLTDPTGDVRWEEEVVAPARRDESREFEPIVGEWTLKMSLEGATGGYDVHWQASG